MKKLAMVLAIAFTMGLAASTVNAATVNEEKPKKECTATEKKSCATSDKAACCSKDKKASTETKAPATDKKAK